jgi:hypothetical protein
LKVEILFGKVEQECRPMAVLEAASIVSVALPAQLSLDLNNSPTSIQLGLHSKFYGNPTWVQIELIGF